MKKTAGANHLSTAATCGTRNRARAWLCAAAIAFVAGVEFRDLNFFLGAKRCVLQLDLHVVTQIGSAPPIFCTFAASKECLENSAAESASAEHLPENLERIVESAAAKTSAARSERRVAKAIVGSALVRIDQNIVRFA